MSTTAALVLMIVCCIVGAGLIHEFGSDDISLAYELLFWGFISLTVYFLLLITLIRSP